MARATFDLPGVLSSLLDLPTSVTVEAETLQGALDALLEKEPRIGLHLFAEHGRFREHVLCYHNDVNTRWMDDLHGPLADGDVIRILQAVSGG